MSAYGLPIRICFSAHNALPTKQSAHDTQGKGKLIRNSMFLQLIKECITKPYFTRASAEIIRYNIQFGIIKSLPIAEALKTGQKTIVKPQMKVTTDSCPDGTANNSIGAPMEHRYT